MRGIWWSAAILMTLLTVGAADSARHGHVFPILVTGMNAVIGAWCIREAVLSK